MDQDGNIYVLKIQHLPPLLLLIYLGTSIGTEVERYYCRAKLFGIECVL